MSEECFGCKQNWPLRPDGIHESGIGDLARCTNLGRSADSRKKAKRPETSRILNPVNSGIKRGTAAPRFQDPWP